MKTDRFLIKPDSKFRLKDYDPGDTDGLKDKEEGKAALSKHIKTLVDYQDKLYAQDTHAILIIVQAMDTSGKDGVIRSVMSGLSPIGTHVYAFKSPSSEELSHDFLWRCTKVLPERGSIAVFNRSYYEDVLIVRVHPELLDAQKLPEEAKTKNIWKDRFEQINDYERNLVSNGTIVLKFFLYLSKEEQRQRLLARIETPEKNWKFSLDDIKERACWDEYMKAFEDALDNTSTKHAPWYIIPADHKWYTRASVAAVIAQTLESLDPKYPTVDDEQKAKLLEAKESLENE
ncbi:MAG: polyphosphate kinase 2 family protein [bacterium]|nr:polyphosphate kinase 2 family protein [Candidatus Kapabacteria bacterium]